jgi:hypothetical protein
LTKPPAARPAAVDEEALAKNARMLVTHGVCLRIVELALAIIARINQFVRSFLP